MTYSITQTLPWKTLLLQLNQYQQKYDLNSANRVMHKLCTKIPSELNKTVQNKGRL